MSQILDTRFRSALTRLAQGDRVLTYQKPVDPHLEIAAILKKLDGKQALLFPSVNGCDTPVIGSSAELEGELRGRVWPRLQWHPGSVRRAMGGPLVPEVVTDAPVQEVVL